MGNNQSIETAPLTGPKSKIDIKRKHTQQIFKNITDNTICYSKSKK